MKELQVVAAVVTDGHEMLCVQKGATPYAYTSYKYEFPGGKIEKGETPQQALKREMREELDCEVTVGPLLVSVKHSYPDFAITLHVYLCRTTGRQLSLKEHVACQWLSCERLRTLDWAEADLKVVQSLLEMDKPPCPTQAE